MTRALPRLGRLATALVALAAATGIVATAAPAHADTGNSCDKYRFLGSKWYITVNGNTVVQAQYSPAPDQVNAFTWCKAYVGSVSDGNLYWLTNQGAGSDKCMSSNGVAGAPLLMLPCTPSNLEQFWRVTHGSYNGADVWSFRSYIHPGTAGQAASNAYGAAVVSEPVSNNLNQWMEIM
ncbi:RICIN domain-containing protein [Actinoplanes sp. NPDC051343]|jgi:hypothetical protein|uniref:RICIN domain-containing protein n=1 Tax=Actinoplanes sp. NPDC051343 TaxID=3363906 RepID=UPI00379A3332